ncbi:heat shock 70 kDa protein 17-like [Hibiscus syriacus]|uniref:heat shock 70 kDa protein 17-like n=1 Tax=Hibiscus syriacus TaxID=106335 RepID=UPI0019217BCC|nr:heat shock 70 kDa protein 17-like [Hibiscus syriacus]
MGVLVVRERECQVELRRWQKVTTGMGLGVKVKNLRLLSPPQLSKLKKQFISRKSMLFRLGVCLSLLSLFLIKSESAVSSIDLGSEWLKVAVVNLRPGQSPITIAINEMSKRKSPALVAFQSEARLLGEEAAGIVARYPDKVFSNLRDMIGKPYQDVKRFADAMYLPFDVIEDSRGAAKIRVSSDVSYSVEELMGMILKYASNLAEFHSKVTVKDAVISVPPYFGQAERKGLLRAAELAGINVISLINEHSGAALQYGIDKDFSNESRHVIFYDMGSSSTYAALVYFSAYNAKEYGKTISVNQFQVKDVRWDSELGGQNMELRLVEHFADEFNKQVGNGVDVRKHPKAMAKLKKQVKRTKEILSANTAAPISVESLYDDRDFRSTITREKFEELCADLWDKSLLPVKEVLKHSGLQADDIYAVELIGGATRVPKLQAKLQEYFGRKGLDKHLDADEAIVLGSALHAANLSDGIKLNRKLGMVDGSSYSFVVEIDGSDLSKDEASRLLVVPRMKKLPSKMFKSLNHSKDFEVSLAYDREDLLPPGISSPVFTHYVVSGLTDTAEKYSAQNLSAPIKTNLHFYLSRSGILSLDQADAVIQITEWIEVPKKNLTLENTVSASSNVTDDKVTNSTTEQSNNNLESDGGSSNVSDDTVEEPSTKNLGTERKLKKRTIKIPLKIVDKTTGPGMPLSKESLADAKRRLEALDKKDAERRRTSELKNNLEEYIYATKEKLETSEEIEKVSSNDERQSVIEKLDEVQEWLYTDGEDASATEFQDRLNSLKAAADPICFRFKELTARPEAVEVARRYLTDLQQTIRGWETDKPWLPKDRIDELSSSMDKLKTWLDEKEVEQKKMPGYSTPVFTSEEVYEKVFNLQDKADSVKRIPKPKPKVEKPPKNDTETKSENTTSSDSTPEKDTSENDKPAGDSDGSTDEEVDGESEPHDEL